MVDFSLRGVDGETYGLKSFADRKAVVVVFSCNHCPYVQAYETRMVQLQQDYLPRSVTLVAINSNDETIEIFGTHSILFYPERLLRYKRHDPTAVQ